MWKNCVSTNYPDALVFADVQELLSSNYLEDKLYAYLKNQVYDGSFDDLAESLQAMVEYKRLFVSYKKFGKNEFLKKELKKYPEDLSFAVEHLRAIYCEEKIG